MKDNLGFYDKTDTQHVLTERRIQVLQENIKAGISELQGLHERSYLDLLDDLDLIGKTNNAEECYEGDIYYSDEFIDIGVGNIEHLEYGFTGLTREIAKENRGCFARLFIEKPKDGGSGVL